MLETIRKRVRIGILPLTTIMLLAHNPLKAQSQQGSALERIVTIDIKEVPAKLLLDNIALQASVVFSYSPKVLANRPPLSLSANQQPIRLVLTTAFGETVNFKQRGKYIILTDGRTEYGKPFGDKPQIIEGYITDPRTGQRVSNATVYDQKLLLSALTDQYGYFKMEVPYGESSSGLKVKKAGFVDTIIVPNKNRNSMVLLELPSVALAQLKDISVKGESFLTTTFPKWLLSSSQKANSLNVGDTIYRNWQVSFLPYIGTNRQLSGNVVNKFSYNIIGGYSMGVRVMEISSMVNIVRGDARYFMAGAANYVGGHMKGVQLANVFNRTQSVGGVQMAGVTNIVFGNINGVQLAGVANLTRSTVRGVQAAGVYNHADTVKGFQLTGVAGSTKMLAGVQVSGVASYAKAANTQAQVAGVTCLTWGTVTGLQVAGVANMAKRVAGVQLSGVYNQADTVSGIQLSGVLNRAKIVKGLQFGLINLADSSNGVSVGLFSFIKKGYHRFELSSDELFYTNVAFRSGTKRFHNILTAGIRPTSFSHPLWMYGVGLGTSMGLSPKLQLDIDLYSNSVIVADRVADNNKLYQVYIGLDRNIGKRSSIAFGITTNILNYADTPLGGSQMLSDAIPYTLWSKKLDNGRTTCGWIGGKVSWRF